MVTGTVCGMKIRVTWNDRGIDRSWNIVLFIFLEAIEQPDLKEFLTNRKFHIFKKFLNDRNAISDATLILIVHEP